jgi:hypothetical protein
MSKGSRRKRATRPWQNPDALRDIGDLVAATRLDDDLALDGYEVRPVSPERAIKDFICPECGNVVPAGESHVVVWPAGDADLRRHWHRHCWRVEVRRSASRD